MILKKKRKKKENKENNVSRRECGGGHDKEKTEKNCFFTFQNFETLIFKFRDFFVYYERN